MNPTEDVTRGSVQKSVCVLSRLPLYGHIQVKMALITEAFFREGDFSRLDLIHQTYDNLRFAFHYNFTERFFFQIKQYDKNSFCEEKVNGFPIQLKIAFYLKLY